MCEIKIPEKLNSTLQNLVGKNNFARSSHPVFNEIRTEIMKTTVRLFFS